MARSQAEREKALTRDSKTCQICGRGIRDGTNVEVHHHKKLGFGGRKLNDVADNMITLCRECHTKVESHKWKIVSLVPLEVQEKGARIHDLHRNYSTGL